MTDAPPDYREPTFGQRLLARILDSLVLVPIVVISFVLTDGRITVMINVIAAAIYEIYLISNGGQTVGKMVMGTRVVDRATGALPDEKQATTRWLTFAAGTLVAIVIPALGGLSGLYSVVVAVPILRRPLHLGVHDMTAGTIVTSIS